MNEVNLKRLNRLFRILQIKEANYSNILDSLDLISFKSLISNDKNFLSENKYKNEIQKYLNYETGSVYVEAKVEFVEYLQNLSNYHSFVNIRNTSKSKLPLVL